MGTVLFVMYKQIHETMLSLPYLYHSRQHKPMSIKPLTRICERIYTMTKFRYRSAIIVQCAQAISALHRPYPQYTGHIHSTQAISALQGHISITQAISAVHRPYPQHPGHIRSTQAISAVHRPYPQYTGHIRITQAISAVHCRPPQTSRVMVWNGR